MRPLEQIKACRSMPIGVRAENGPEYLGQHSVDQREENQTAIRHIQPDRPNQNVHVEWFNRMYRSEGLDACLFDNLGQVRQMTAE